MTGRRAAIVAALIAAVALVAILRTGRAPDEGDPQTDVAVHVTRIGRGTVRHLVTAYGSVAPEPAGSDHRAGGAVITPFVDGVVAGVDAVEGSAVRQGAILVRLDSRMAEVAVQSARQQVDFTQQAFDRQEALLATDGTSQRAYLEARQQRDAARSALAAAETDLAYRRIASPLSGTLTRLNVVVGQHVDATTVLAEVVDLDRLVVTAEIPAREIAGIAVGQPVLLGDGDEAPIGAVQVLAKGIDPVTGTYRVQASIPSGAGLTPGQFTDIRIVGDEHEDVLVVPEVAVVTTTDAESWIVVVEGDRAARRSVTVGLRENGLVEVSGEGISEGLTVVTDEAYSLPEETAIHVVSD